MIMRWLSPHFLLEEMTRTDTGLPNVCPPALIPKLELLCVRILEPVREHFGRPVRVNSGYRSPKVNAAVGSKPTSQHAKAEAVDFEVPGVTNLKVAQWVRDNLEFDQLIGEAFRAGDPAAGWVHASLKASGNRRSVLTMTMGSHGPVYTKGLPNG